MTPIERVRSALTYAAHEAPNDYWRERYNETLRELEGMCIVPVEPDALTLEYGFIELQDPSKGHDEMRKIYRAMIAQYMKGDKDAN